MPKKSIYIAGKLNEGELSIVELAKELEHNGHKIIEKWWTKSKLPTPYMDNYNSSSVAANRMINGAYNCDIFILFTGNNILGAAVELGVAIASTIINPDKSVIIIDQGSSRQSVFYAHHNVTYIDSIDNLKIMDWY